MKKNKFTVEEDRMMLRIIKRCGKKIDWRMISLEMENKSPRQCRERYNYHLKAELKKGYWTEEEDKMLLIKYNEFGPKWKKISTFVPGRTSDSTRNRILCLIKKRKYETQYHPDKVDYQTNNIISNSAFEVDELFSQNFFEFYCSDCSIEY